MDEFISKKLVENDTELPKVFFISQPMRGKSDIEIKAERTAICEWVKRTINPRAEFVNSILDLDTPDGIKSTPMYYLGKSITLMAKADAVIMATGWETARGCRCEEVIAESYGTKIYFR